MTARKITDSGMIFRKKGISMSGTNAMDEFSRKIADPEKIANIINILNLI
jgi:hypothetical protein